MNGRSGLPTDNVELDDSWWLGVLPLFKMAPKQHQSSGVLGHPNSFPHFVLVHSRPDDVYRARNGLIRIGFRTRHHTERK